MNLKITLALAFAFSLSVLNVMNAQDVIVQLGAFEKSVDKDYFGGFGKVKHRVDNYGFHKYFLTGFSSLAEAEKVQSKALQQGFRALLIENSVNGFLCYSSCEEYIEPGMIKSIFFDFDKSALRTSSVQELNKLKQLLKRNPNMSAELKAHTDSKGDFKYNESLSLQRAKASKDYLVRQGVSPFRIRVSTFGETSPIALNANNGADTPAGRQYNRRVELKVYDENGVALNQIVEDINVPDFLSLKKETQSGF